MNFHEADAMESGLAIAAECRRTGRWEAAAIWLASTLNALPQSTLTAAKSLERRLATRAAIDGHVALVEGDRRQPDVISLPDGSKVCWHLGRRRRETRWVAELPGQRCGYGRP